MPEEYNLVIIGNGGVGKSALTIQFVSHHFPEEYDPTIEDSYQKECVVDGQPCVLNILDTAGQEEYSAMIDHYMGNGDGYLLIYSVDNIISFRDLENVRTRAARIRDIDEGVIGGVPIVLVGNKCDIPKENWVVTTEMASEMALKYRFPHYETSAKTRVNVEEAFFGLTREIRNLRKKKKESEPKTKKSGRCALL